MNKEQMIDLLNEDLKNEWKHLSFYLYHASAFTGPFAPEYKEMFLEEAASEMKHITEFSDVIYGLGGYATADANAFPKFNALKDILGYALSMEEEVVNNYVQRMHDANTLGGTDGQWLEIFLEGQVQASREDVDKYRQIIRGM